MSTIRQWSERDVIKMMKKNGYKVVRICGSHRIWQNDSNNSISIPKGEPNKMLLLRLCKENHLTM